MSQFSYKAMQADGGLIEGFLEASNRQEAIRQVEIRGLKPIRLAEDRSQRGPRRIRGRAGSRPA